jgi:ATP-dependent Clp protease ATP-binding subunit ClpC
VSKRALGKGVTLGFEQGFKDLLYANGFSPRFGARPMRRCVRGLLENNLAECMLDGFAKDGDVVTFDYDASSDLICVKSASSSQSRTFQVEFGSGIEDVDEQQNSADKDDQSFPAPSFGGAAAAQSFA